MDGTTRSFHDRLLWRFLERYYFRQARGHGLLSRLRAGLVSPNGHV